MFLIEIHKWANWYANNSIHEIKEEKKRFQINKWIVFKWKVNFLCSFCLNNSEMQIHYTNAYSNWNDWCHVCDYLLFSSY